MEKINIIYDFFFLYLGIAIIFAILTLLDFLKVHCLIKKVALFNIFIGIVLFTGLRTDGTGLDFYSYQQIFESIDTITHLIDNGIGAFENIHGEFGFLLLNALMKSLTGDFNVFLLTMAFISLGLVFYSTYRYSPFVFLSLFFYVCRFFFIREMGGIRFAVAASIIFYGLQFVQEKKLWKFLFSVAIASLFHLNALAAFPVYFINIIAGNKKRLVILLITALILGSMPPMDIIMFLYSITNDYRLYFYAQNMNDAFFGYAATIGVFSVGTLSQIPILLLFWRNREKLKHSLTYYDVMFSAYFLSVFYRIALNQIPFVASRTGLLMSTVEMIIIPSFLLLVKNKMMAYMVIILIGFLSIIMTFMDIRNIENYGIYKSLLWH